MTPTNFSRRSDFRDAGRSAGFALLELLIVMALILVLFTLYFGGPQAHTAKQLAGCNKNLQNIYVAMKTYSMDNGDKFPVLMSAQTSEEPLSLLIPKYTTGTEYFICPGSKDDKLAGAKPFANKQISYAYYMGQGVNSGADQPLISDRQINTAGKEIGQPVFSQDGKKPGNNHKKSGGNILFCDGQIQASPAMAAFRLVPSTNVVLLNPKP